jgi:hypothetical protein
MKGIREELGKIQKSPTQDAVHQLKKKVDEVILGLEANLTESQEEKELQEEKAEEQAENSAGEGEPEESPEKKDEIE